MTHLRYYILYKPFGTICQFSPEGNHPTLADLGYAFPTDVYPVGRLDTDSEGLLILTNDKKLNALLLHPSKRHARTYWVQVEGQITSQALQQLAQGVTFSLNGKPYHTLPAQAQAIEAREIPERNPPVRFRKTVPDSWLALTLFEGKNRQVRRMTAQTGFPTLRLIRHSIEKLDRGALQPGEVQEIDGKLLYRLLQLEKA